MVQHWLAGKLSAAELVKGLMWCVDCGHEQDTDAQIGPIAALSEHEACRGDALQERATALNQQRPLADPLKTVIIIMIITLGPSQCMSVPVSSQNFASTVSGPILAPPGDWMHKQELLLMRHRSAFMCVHGSTAKRSARPRLFRCCSHIHNKIKC